MDEKSAWLNLSLTPGLGITTLWRLVRALGSPQAVLEAKAPRLEKVNGVQRRHLSGLLNRVAGENLAPPELERLQAFGGRVVSWDDSLYPSLLKEIVDPPPVLYIVGDPALLSRPAVAVVGSRAASSYGRHAAFNLAQKLAAAGAMVVSGLALGIDAEAHRGALAAGGATAAILGFGLDVVYPRQNEALYREIGYNGLLISEYPLGTRPDGWRFPARNRIIAGMSRGVVVAEAARKSGSLITAQMGLDFGREVFAVPGQIDSDKSEGCHLLLREGASLVMDVADILREVGLSPGDQGPAARVSVESQTDAALEPEAVQLLQCIENYAAAKDDIIERSGFSPGRVSELLLMLELDGLVESLPGDQVRRVR